MSNQFNHISEIELAAYALGQCSPNNQQLIEEHCFACEACRAQLAILLRLHAEDSSHTQTKQYRQLFPQSVAAISQVHQSASSATRASAQGHNTNQPAISKAPATAAPSAAGSFWSRYKLANHPLAIAATLFCLTIGGLAYIFFVHLRNSPIQAGLKALRKSYENSRPLEARVTGGFQYQPYAPTRGAIASSNESVDRDQLNYALAELTRAVASYPTAEARHALGRLYLLLGDFNQAQDQLTQALANANSNSKLHADMAALFYERSKFAEPLPLLKQAIDHYNKAIDLEPDLAEAWFNRALCYEQMALFSAARKDWERYLQLDSNSPWANEAREHLRQLIERTSLNKQAAGQVLANVQQAVELNQPETLRSLLTEHFVIVKEHATGPLLDAYLTAALTNQAAQKEKLGQALALLGQLSAEIKQDHYISDLSDLVARGSPAVHQRLQETRTILQKANQEYAKGSLSTALTLYQQAKQTAALNGDSCHTELATYALARNSSFRDKLTTTAYASPEFIQQLARKKHRQLQAQTFVVLANAAGSNQQHSESLEYSSQAANIAKELGDLEIQMNSLRLSGASYARLGSFDTAIAKNFEAVTIKQAPEAAKMRIYTHLGDTLFRKGEFHHALAYQNEALQIANSTTNTLFQTGLVGRISLSQAKLNQTAAAQASLERAITQAKTLTDETARTILLTDFQAVAADFALAQGKHNEAIQAYQQVLLAAKKTGTRAYLAACHQGLAQAYLAKGQLTEAEAELKTSLAITERDRQFIRDAQAQSAFLASRQTIYQSLVEFEFLQKNDIAAAYYYSELGRHRELAARLTQTVASNQTTAATPKIQTLARVNAAPLPLRELQQRLSSNAQVLAYAVTEKQLFCWLITRQNITAKSSPIAQDRLNSLVSNYLQNLRTKRHINTLNQQATELYEILLGPVAAQLKPAQLLCIIPDNKLSALPFAALVAPDSKRYLVDDYAVSMHPHADLLLQSLKTPKIAAASFLGISNPNFKQADFPQLPKLPAADQEITRINQLYSNGIVLRHQAATESAVLNQTQRFDVLHIASHILVNDYAPLLSSVVLAPEPTQMSEDGRTMPPGSAPLKTATLNGNLQAFEILQRQVPRGRIVILAGCRSAVGSPVRSEAISSLAQAFFATGATGVIASLWDIDDTGTAQLMTAMHTHRQTKQVGFAEALRQAQITLAHQTDQKYQHPFYWAAFQLLGNG